GVRGDPAWVAALAATQAAFGQACLEHTGELLGHVGTEDAARDLDMLRAALGDEKLNYLGYSYGTLLGATYAELFPDHTGRMVFVGAVDPSIVKFDVTLAQARCFERAFRNYLDECVQSSQCPFRGSVDAAMQEVRDILDTLDASPLTAKD